MNLKFWEPKTCVCSNDGAKVYRVFQKKKSTVYQQITNYCTIQKKYHETFPRDTNTPPFYP